MALQRYSIYRHVSSGGHARIALSRIPILSGELLRGVGRLAFVLTFVKGAAIVLPFFAILGINGQSNSVWVEDYGGLNGYTQMTSLRSGRHVPPSTRSVFITLGHPCGDLAVCFQILKGYQRIASWRMLN